MPAVTDTVISGPYLLAALLAVAAGAVSFASPCVIPLVPGYLAYVTSLVGAQAAVAVPAGRRSSADAAAEASRVSLAIRGKAVTATALFVLGFTVVFLAQSVAVIGFSRAILVNSETLMRVGGAVTIVMGLAMLGLIRPLQAEPKIGFHKIQLVPDIVTTTGILHAEKRLPLHEGCHGVGELQFAPLPFRRPVQLGEDLR